MCAIIRNPTTSMPSLRACSMCCFAMSASVRMRGDPHRLRAGGVGRVEILDGADAGQQQHGDLRALHAVGRPPRSTRRSRVRAEPVVEARAGQAVAVADFDGIDARAIERRRDRSTCVHRILVPDGVHAVAQRDVLDVELGLPRSCDGARRSAHRPCRQRCPPAALRCAAPPTS